MKRCTKCGETKPLEAFAKESRKKSGIRSMCKPCWNAKCKQVYLKRRDKRAIEMRRWHEKNPEKRREYYEKHRDEIRARQKTPRAKMLGRLRKRAEHKRRGHILLARAKANRPKYRERILAYNRQPHRRVHSNMSRSIRSCIHSGKNGRKWESIVGYTRDELVAHLESQFKEGMTWENYGAWEIDHIRPKASFAFQSDADAEFKECWKLSNLQPLWMPENRRKWAHFGSENEIAALAST
jgi:hypothetical protein